MKKIKKLREVTLKENEMSSIYGGSIVTCNGETNDLSLPREVIIAPSDPPPPLNPPPSSCKCGCSGCAYEDGGAGFSVGMVLSKTDGHSCSFFALF